MSLIPKSFRFTEQEIFRIEEIRVSMSLSKDIEVIRRGIDTLYNQWVDNKHHVVHKPVVVQERSTQTVPVVQPKTKVEYIDPTNPYQGWVVLGQGTDYTTGNNTVTIKNTRPKFESKTLMEGDEHFSEFYKSDDIQI